MAENGDAVVDAIMATPSKLHCQTAHDGTGWAGHRALLLLAGRLADQEFR